MSDEIIDGRGNKLPKLRRVKGNGCNSQCNSPIRLRDISLHISKEYLISYQAAFLWLIRMSNLITTMPQNIFRGEVKYWSFLEIYGLQRRSRDEWYNLRNSCASFHSNLG